MYYDLLPKIKNAERAGKSFVLVPFSKMDFVVAKILVGTGHLSNVQKKTIGSKNHLEIKLIKKGKNDGAVVCFKIVSKPGRRIYIDSRHIKRVRQGYGVGVISTSKGIMNDKDARQNKVGGEYLFEIW